MNNGIIYHLDAARSKNQQSQEIDFDKVHIQLCVPEKRRKSVLQACHDCMAGGGHFGLKKTHHAIRDKYYWPKMFTQIETYVNPCDTCQRTKVLRNKPPSPLSPLPVGEPFSRVHILGPLPTAKEQPY